MEKLRRIIYVSHLDSASFNSDMLSNILSSARKNNPSLDITGMLLFNYRYFLQMLEGPSDSVSKLLEVIAQDSRHTGIVVIDDSEVNSRVFKSWNMGFSTGSADELLFSDDPHKMISAKDALALFKQLSVNDPAAETRTVAEA